MSVVANCNTLITNGFNLQDLPKIKAQVREAVLLHAQDNSYTTFPDAFLCSHCGNSHALTPEEIRDGLFHGPGSTDLVASYNEFLATIDGIPAAEVGSDFTNGVASTTDLEIDKMINPDAVINTPVDPNPVAADVITEVATDDHQIVVESGGE